MAVGTNNALINTRPGEKSRLATALDAFLRQHHLRDDNLLPATVVSYDRTKNIVQVQPLIKIVSTTATTMSRNPLANIPALSLGGGGYHLNFPLKKGDLGWILAADRDISTFLETLKESPPNSTRIHNFGDAWFIPDVFRQYTISSEDDDNDAFVIQSTDSTLRIAISEGNGKIKITAPSTVIISTPQTTITGNVTIDQNLTVNGNSTIEGNETVNGTLTNNGIDVTTHGHISESPGTRTGNMEA